MELAKKLNERDKDAREEETRDLPTKKERSPPLTDPPQAASSPADTNNVDALRKGGNAESRNNDTNRSPGEAEHLSTKGNAHATVKSQLDNGRQQQQKSPSQAAHDSRNLSSNPRPAFSVTVSPTTPRSFSTETNGAVSYFTSAVASPRNDLGQHVFYGSGSSHERMLPRSPPSSQASASSSTSQVSVKFEHAGSYQGGMKNGEREGTGTFKWEDGELFNGDWAGDMFHGWGIYQWRNGQKYSGYWKNGRHDGQGYMSWSLNENMPGWRRAGRYTGSFMNGFRAGKGSETQAELGCYTGEWQQDMRAGEGMFKWLNGSRYLGEWSCDQRNGSGVFTWADGSWFQGSFRDEWPLSGTLVDMYEECYHVEYRQVQQPAQPPALEMRCQLLTKTHLGHLSTQKQLLLNGKRMLDKMSGYKHVTSPDPTLSPRRLGSLTPSDSSQRTSPPLSDGLRGSAVKSPHEQDMSRDAQIPLVTAELVYPEPPALAFSLPPGSLFKDPSSSLYTPGSLYKDPSNNLFKDPSSSLFKVPSSSLYTSGSLYKDPPGLSTLRSPQQQNLSSVPSYASAYSMHDRQMRPASQDLWQSAPRPADYRSQSYWSLAARTSSLRLSPSSYGLTPSSYSPRGYNPPAWALPASRRGDWRTPTELLSSSHRKEPESDCAPTTYSSSSRPAHSASEEASELARSEATAEDPKRAGGTQTALTPGREETATKTSAAVGPTQEEEASTEAPPVAQQARGEEASPQPQGILRLSPPLHNPIHNSVNGGGGTSMSSWDGRRVEEVVAMNTRSNKMVLSQGPRGLGMERGPGTVGLKLEMAPSFFPTNKKIVRGIKAGSSADRSQMIQLNDELLAVDGQDVTEQELFAVKQMIAGPAGSVVFLELRREAGMHVRRFSVGLTREPVASSSSWSMDLSMPDESRAPPLSFQSVESCDRYIGFTDASCGLGIIPAREADALLVHSLVPGGPAAKCGFVRPGDSILAVDDVEVEGSRMEEVTRMLEGEEGRTLVVKLLNSNKEPYSVVLTAIKYPPSVPTSSALPPVAAQQRPELVEVGMLLHQDKERRVTVRAVKPGGLADQHGLLVGSQILSVQRQDVAGLRLSSITRLFADLARGVPILLRTPEGTVRSVTLGGQEMMQGM